MHPNALRFQQEVDSKIYLSEVDPSAKQAIQNTFIGSTTYSAGQRLAGVSKQPSSTGAVVPFAGSTVILGLYLH